MNKINKEELRDKIQSDDDITVVEVLEPQEYKKGHIKEAINIPLGEIVSKARDKFDFDKKIVVYCSDAECDASPTAARKLKDSGFNHVYHYAGGKKEWQQAGYPME